MKPGPNHEQIRQLIAHGDLRAALGLAMEAAETGDADSLFTYGRLLRETGQARAAVEPLQAAQAAGFEPATEALLQLALAYADLRQETEAMELLQALLESEPGHALAKFNLATLHQAAGRGDQAERIFLQVFERDPTFTEALVRVIYGRKMSAADGPLLRRAEKRARSQVTPPMDQEGLQFALAKAYDDLGDHRNALAKARIGNRMQARRSGDYDATDMADFTDRMIEQVTSDWLSRPVCDAAFAPIFIVGHFRSGSTLTEQLLSGHAGTRSLGEIDYFLRLWFEDRPAFLALFEPGSESRLQQIADEYRDLTAAMGAGVVRGIDKRPENLLFMGLLRKLFPGARFVHTRRNLLDNAVSVYFQQLNDLSRFGTSLAGFVDYDRQCQRLAAHWRALFGDAIHAVDYENLVQSPEPQARALLGFLGLDWDPACLDFVERRNFVRTASVAQVREGFHSRSVGRGERYLPYLESVERALFGRD